MKRRDQHQYVKTRDKEFYFLKAKKEGYRARSAYKLIQIQEKFNIISKNSKVLDLGCAPGAWLQVIKKFTNHKIIGVDLLAINNIENVEFFKEDIFSVELYDILKQNKFDVVFSDIAPNCTGNNKLDHYRIYNIIEHIVELYVPLIVNQGHFCFKMFEGSETIELVDKLKLLFCKVKVFKPKASACDSTEIYIVCLNKNN